MSYAIRFVATNQIHATLSCRYQVTLPIFGMEVIAGMVVTDSCVTIVRTHRVYAQSFSTESPNISEHDNGRDDCFESDFSFLDWGCPVEYVLDLKCFSLYL